eukprot:UN21043
MTVLIMGGSFNPIHTEHINSFNLAKSYLEKQGFKVV